MSSSYRPSWMPPADALGGATPFRPILLVCLLAVNAVLVGTIGYLIGDGDAGISSGLKLALMLPVPYAVAALLSWWGADEFGYGLAKGLAFGGLLAWSFLFYFFQNMDLVAGPRPGGGTYTMIGLGMLLFHLAILLLARQAAIRTHGSSRVEWTAAGFVVSALWFLMTLGA
ncbi:MAG TPA: hypothetical protein VFI52_04835 [Gemmatimonadaceae bacterium]|nr:hypothetical protein [Gemmatimonadaceae bacterium]